MVRFLIASLRRLPLALRERLGALGGAIFALVPTRDRRIAELQIRRFLAPSEPKKLTHAVYREAGRTALTALDLGPLLPRVRAADEAFVQALLDSRRPVLALTAHIGVWDLLGAYGVARGFNVATIGRAARSPALHAALSGIREGYGIRTLWRDDRDGVRGIITHLKANGLIAALIDQDTRVTSVFSPFFGHPAHTPSALIELARRYDAAIVTAFIHRSANGEHVIDVQAIPDDATLAEVLSAYHSRLEDAIRAHPAQWVWFHKRWRTLDGGRRLSSREYEDWLKRTADDR